MTKVEMVKSVGSLVVSMGVFSIVGNVVKATTPAVVGPVGKVCIAVGSLVITEMISDAATARLEQKIDSVVGEIKDLMVNATQKINERIDIK